MFRRDGRQQDRAEQIAEETRTRVEQVADQAREELAEVQARMRALRRDLVTRAMAVKDKAAEEMLAAAQRIRREAQDSKDVETVARAAAIAEELERTAGFLDRQTIAQMREDVRQTVEENTWALLAAAFIVGLALGLLVAVGRRR